MTIDSSAPVRDYLRQCISSLNSNKLYGIRAEADFRAHIASMGVSQRVSPGGWIFRQKGATDFGKNTIAVFPQTLAYGADYSAQPTGADIPLTLHTICATLHQIGIRSYYARPVFSPGASLSDIEWRFRQLGVPWETDFVEISGVFSAFRPRLRPYNYLRYKTDVSLMSDQDAIIQFSHDNLRIFVENRVMSETSDIDGIVWGERLTYPIEIKEKTVVYDSDIGDWFGLDTGPFVKLAHYAARRGNLHSLFIVREVEDTPERKLLRWLFADFDEIARYASWVPRAGGQSMGGGRSMVVRIPRTAFRELDASSFGTI